MNQNSNLFVVKYSNSFGTEYYRGPDSAKFYADGRRWTFNRNQACVFEDVASVLQAFSKDYENRANYTMDPTNFSLEPV